MRAIDNRIEALQNQMFAQLPLVDRLSKVERTKWCRQLFDEVLPQIPDDHLPAVWAYMHKRLNELKSSRNL